MSKTISIKSTLQTLFKQLQLMTSSKIKRSFNKLIQTFE